MSGQQLIIDRIIEEAEANAQGIVSRARIEAEKILSEARLESEKKGVALLEKAQEDAESIIASAYRERDLAIRRRLLSVRFTAIEEAFELAKKQIMSLSDADYLEYISRQISTHAQDGDEIIISAIDKKRITPDFIKGIAKAQGIKLSLSDELGDFEGGVILKSMYWDSNLTIESNFKVFRDKFEAKVSKMLSGEDND